MPTWLLDKSLLLADGGFAPALAGLSNLEEGDGDPYVIDANWPYVMLGHWLGFHYNHTDESKDIGESTNLARDEVAYSLWIASPPQLLAGRQREQHVCHHHLAGPGVDGPVQARPHPGGIRPGRVPVPLRRRVEQGQSQRVLLRLPAPGRVRLQRVRLVGHEEVRVGYNAAKYRTYAAGRCIQRSSSDMAKSTGTHITFSNLKVGDLMFFASNGGKLLVRRGPRRGVHRHQLDGPLDGEHGRAGPGMGGRRLVPRQLRVRPAGHPGARPRGAPLPRQQLLAGDAGTPHRVPTRP